MNELSTVIRVLLFILITAFFAIVMLTAELIRPSNSSTEWTQSTDTQTVCVAIICEVTR